MTTRRALLRGASIAALGGASAAVAAALPAVASTRPSGTGYVRYEDLYRSGDTVSAALARLPVPADAAHRQVVTFPAGTFYGRGFTSPNATCINVPQWCGGIIGSGSGNLAGTTSGTYFGITAHTASGSGTVLGSADARYPQVFSQFSVMGTEQGQVFTGASFARIPSLQLSNLFICGHSGTANYPPGETFGLNVQGIDQHTVTDVEVDCRRADGGRYGTSPITAQDCDAGTWTRVYAHHALAGMPTFYQASHIQTYNFHSAYNGTGSGKLNGHCINHERTTGIVHHSPQLYLDRTNGNTGCHIGQGNDNTSDPRSGNTVQGTLTIIDPTYNDAFGNGLLYVQSYVRNGVRQTVSPVVEKSDGTAIPFKWLH